MSVCIIWYSTKQMFIGRTRMDESSETDIKKSTLLFIINYNMLNVIIILFF